MLLPLALLMAVLVSYQLLRLVRISKYWKLLPVLLITAAALKSQIVYLLGGDNYFAPDLPGWLLITAAWFYAVIFFSSVLLILPAAATFTAIIYCKSKKIALPEKFRQSVNKLNIALLLTAVLLASAALANGLRSPALRHVELFLNDLPPEAENYRITVLADLHIDRTSSPEKVRKLVERVNELQSNTVVILGDTVDGKVATLAAMVGELSELRASDGVFGIMGNHEYFSGGREWVEFFAACNIKMLLNEHVELRKGFYLAGITDPAAGYSKGSMAMPDLAEALRGIAPDACTVLLAHRPGHAVKAAEKAVALQLSGHTHGGMIPGVSYLVGRFNENFVSGLYHVKNMLLYVSNGSSIWSGFPFRLWADSEITIITLKSKGNKK